MRQSNLPYVTEIFSPLSLLFLPLLTLYIPDPRAAEAVLNVLVKIVKVKIDFESLRHKAQQIDQITARIRDIESQQGQEQQGERREDLGYIG